MVLFHQAANKLVRNLMFGLSNEFARMKKFKNIGMTLIEMLLILAVASSILTMILTYSTEKMEELRRDRASLQMEQILNAALAYYVVYGQWPNDAVGNAPASLQGTGTALSSGGAFLPATTLNNPWGNLYTIAQYPSNPDDTSSGYYTYVNSPTFSISTVMPNALEAQLVADRLPYGRTSGTGNKTVTASVSIPGQNLNNARSVNFAQVYSSGACVPVPACPAYITPSSSFTSSSTQSMVPSIFVLPVQVNGTYYAPGTALSPIAGYTAYAIGPGDVTTNGNTTLASCDGTISTNAPCYESSGTQIPTTKNPAGKYYRVCLAIQTHQGAVAPTTNAWGVASGSVLAITRCVPPSGDPVTTSGEQIGTQFNVWSQ